MFPQRNSAREPAAQAYSHSSEVGKRNPCLEMRSNLPLPGSLPRLCGCVLYSGGLGVFPKHPMAQEGCYAQIIIACVHLVGEVPAL